ncbi:Ala-tRNA(Pro) deacylase [Paraburkholderia sp. GAS199]|uniref:YbaK/prolyl-tRNA synthetase associated domain-containing protein n=1 Tax=Paraburkholderia sp. GAS199 TaxID=3035126 RepID=UPI003D1A77F8
MNDTSIFERLGDLLSASGAKFRLMEHVAEGKSDHIAAIRGTSRGQGAKAMLCAFKDSEDEFVLAVIPGDRKVDFRKIAAAAGRKKATLAPAELAVRITGCVVGAIPPFSFSEHVRLIVDPALIQNNREIAFNAGRLDRSIVMDAADYVRVSHCRLVDITRSDLASEETA